MCSKPVRKAVNIAAAVVNPVAALTNGAVAGAVRGGVSGGVGGALQGAQAGAMDPAGAVTGKPTYAPDPIQAQETGTNDAPSLPDAPAPGISTLADSRRRRRLSALRMGILSTIASSAAGDTSTANLLTPAAGAGGGGKTLLGQ